MFKPASKFSLLLIAALAMSAFVCRDSAAQIRVDWPQGAGPNGDWSAVGPEPPLEFSVRTGKNILWRTPLPETGQGGIAVFGDKLFVATMAPWDEKNALSEADAKKFHHATEGRKVVGKDIDAHCLDVKTGKILWTRRISGEVPSIYSYPFSDATSASPVTDGSHVWFTNGSGCVTCFTVAGEKVWERRYTPTFDGPFNKQFEPFLITDPGKFRDGNDPQGGRRSVFVHMEPNEKGWNYLVGLDGSTGKVLWRSEDALTHYNAPTLQWAGGELSILHARGGPHAVPERPVGLSRTAVIGLDGIQNGAGLFPVKDGAGRSLARFEDPRGNHEASLHTMTHDANYVYWVLKKPRSAVAVLGAENLDERKEIALDKGVKRTWRDTESGEFKTEVQDLEKGVFPARYSTIAANDFLYFQCYATAWGKPSLDPPYSFGRVNPATGEVAYMEVPTGVTRNESGDQFVWRTKQSARALNSRGVEVTGDDRSHWDGWDWVFNGSPTRVNNRLYFTLASGLVYVLDANATEFDEHALLAVNDLGNAGEVWTANSISYANGRLYHRTAAELICVGAE